MVTGPHRLPADLLEARAREPSAEVTRLVQQAYRWVGLFYALLVATIAWSGARALLGSPSGALDGLGQAVTVALTILSLAALIVALAVSGRPIQRSAGYGGDMMVFVVWFFVFFAIAMPVIGQIMALVIAIRRLTGNVGGGTIKSGASRTYHEPRKFHHGETVPLGLVYLALALLWPVLLLTWQRATSP